MPPAARTGDETTHGTPLAPGPGSLNVLIGGQPAWRAEIDQHACPALNITGADGVGSVMMGSPTVLINGMMACRWAGLHDGDFWRSRCGRVGGGDDECGGAGFAICFGKFG